MWALVLAPDTARKARPHLAPDFVPTPQTIGRGVYTREMNGDLRIGDWNVQPSVNRLSCGDRVVRLEPKVMQVLVRLADSAGEVVARDEMIKAVWPDVYVTDDVLHRAVRELRRVFGDATASPRYIETIRKRGYRLIAPVSTSPELETVATAPALEPPATAPALDPVSIEPAPDVVPAAARSSHVPAQPVRSGWGFSLVATAVALICTAAVLVVAWRTSDITSQATARFVPLVSGPRNESDPAISPDGRHIAYVQRDAGESSPADIYIRDLNDGRVTKLTTDAASDRMPAWSRDGEQLAFIRATPEACEVMLRSMQTGAERRIVSCGNREEPRTTWTADGTALLMSHAPSLFTPDGWRIARVDIATGAMTALTQPPPGIVGDHSPVVSPDGRSVAFVRRISGGASDIHVAPLTGERPRRITFDEADVMGIDWSNDGRSILFSSDRAGGYTLWRVAAGGGDPVLVAGGAARMKHPVADRARRRVVYENWNYGINVWEVDVSGFAGEDASGPAEAARRAGPAVRAGEHPATSRPVTRSSDLWNLYPQVSPDGTRLAYVSTASGHHELWIANRDGSDARQLTTARGGAVKDPRWSPDGEALAYLARGTGAVDVHVIDPATGSVRALTATAANEVAPVWSHDGREVLFASADASGRWQVFAVPAAGRSQERRLVLPDAFSVQPSADGAWLYFTRPDRRGVWRQRTGSPDAPELVAPAVPAGSVHGWALTARGLYFVDETDAETSLRMAALAPGESTRVAVLNQLTWPGFSVTADGRHVLYARWDRRESNIMAIEY